MAVSLFFYLTADHIKSFQVVQGTLSRNDTYTAFAMRTESVQLSSGSGYVQFYTPNASKIKPSEALFMGFPQQKMPIPLVLRQMRQRERRFVPRSHVFLLIMIPVPFPAFISWKQNFPQSCLPLPLKTEIPHHRRYFMQIRTVLSSTAVMDMKAIRRTALRRSFSLRKPLWFPLIPARRRSLEMQYTVWWQMSSGKLPFRWRISRSLHFPISVR